jgi:predicted membrane protein
VICIVSSIGMLTYRSFMLSVINLCLSLMLSFIRVFAKDVEVQVMYVMGRLRFSCSILWRNLPVCKLVN